MAGTFFRNHVFANIREGIKLSLNSESNSEAKSSSETQTTSGEIENGIDENNDESDRLQDPEEDTYTSPMGGIYNYTDKIPSTQHEKYIRLLELLPGKPKDDIRCRISLHTLNSCLKYEALSYCWGDPTETLPIEIDGRILNVTKSLRAALRHIRDPANPCLLWADAVCINQEDLDERSQQVAIMRDIYQGAQRVVVWLGPSDDNSDLGMDICTSLAEEERTITHYNSPANSKKSPLDSLASYERLKLSDDQDKAIAMILDRPWFERIWVIQEIRLARVAVVKCGWKEIPWETLSRGVKYGLDTGQFEMAVLGVAPVPTYDKFLATMTVRSLNASPPPAEQLLDLLMQLRLRQATNPIDKVYSLLGLVQNVQILDVVYDYRLTAAEVYKQTTISILKHSGTLDILGSCTSRSSSNLPHRLPSWVPDWSISNKIPKPFRLGTEPWSATLSSVCSLAFLANDILVLSGNIIDTITETSEALINLAEDDWFEDKEFDQMVDTIDMDDETLRGLGAKLKAICSLTAWPFKELLRILRPLQTFIQWENLAKIHVKKPDPYPRGQDHVAVYWQTLCAGHMPGGYAETEKLYQEWHGQLSSVRRLSHLKIDTLPSLFKPLAFTSYVHATWKSFSRFGELILCTSWRKLARTREGYLALVPSDTEVGDSIALCKGGKIPLIVRKEESKDEHWKLLGEGYVHGIMKGERWDEEACHEIRLR